MDVSIVIVNWNSRKFLVNCVRSIRRFPPSVPYELIVIDSGSFDGAETALSAEYPEAVFIQSPVNLGFGRANNLAAQHATGDWLLLLNPDTVVQRGSIDTLCCAANGLPDAGIVGPLLLNANGSVQGTCVRAFPTLVNQTLESNLLRRCWPRSRLWGMRPLIDQVSTPTAVDAVSGACAMIRRDLFQRLAGFSDEYFMYSEDLDLCYRVTQEGLRCYYVPGAVVVHYGGASTSQSPISEFSTVMMLESRSRYFARTCSAAHARRFRAAIFVSSIVRLTVLVLLAPFYLLGGRGAQISVAVSKWMAKLRWSVGLAPCTQGDRGVTC